MNGLITFTHSFAHSFTLWLLLFNAMVRGDVITLDISRADGDDRLVKTNFRDPRVSYTVYTARDGYSIDKIVDGMEEIWEVDTQDEFCKNLKVHKVNEKPILLYLNICDGRRYKYIHYQPIRGKWMEITRHKYVSVLNYIVLNVKFDLDGPFDPQIFNVKECPSSGPLSLVYFPKPKFILKEIINGKKPVWKARTSLEKCEYLVLHGNIGNPRLLHAFISNEKDHKIIFLIKKRTRWVKIEANEFHKALKEWLPLQI